MMNRPNWSSPLAMLLSALLAGLPLAQGQQAPTPPPAPAAPLQQPAAALGGLNLVNASLTEVVDLLARQLKINVIVDPRVKGTVTFNTYGEARKIDVRQMLDTILRLNGFAMVQTGEVFRVVPIQELAQMPLHPSVDETNIPEDDRAMLNMVFLKYANAEELTKLLGDFLGPGAKMVAYPPANLLIILDTRRSMKRTMELISMFDSDTLAQQRVRLFEIKHSRPSDIAKELERLMRSISMGKDLQSIKFVPVDRINALLAVAPNPGVFKEVENWLGKLDVKVESAAGKSDTYVYRVRYGRAEILANSIMMLYYSIYLGYPMGGMGYGMGMGMGMGYGMGTNYGTTGLGTMSGMGNGTVGMNGMGSAGYGMGAYGMGGYGMGMGGYGMGMGMGMMNPYAMMGGGYGAMSGQSYGSTVPPAGAGGTASGNTDQTGQYAGASAYGGYGVNMFKGPRVVPNYFDNTLLILATGEEYESIRRLLDQLDVPPRQVLIEARIYEVQLTGAFSMGVSAALQRKGTTNSSGSQNIRQFLGNFTSDGVNLSAGMLVGRSRELFATVTASESQGISKVISAPSIIATDSIAASINVGTEVPTLQSQAVTGVTSGGTNLFANTISNRQTGVTLSITPRVNPSGVVTMQIQQQVSTPQPAGTADAIKSPSFQDRTVSTQITVQDGDMVAIGGIITDQRVSDTSGVPGLQRLPLVGGLFGGKTSSRERTELIIFITPRIIYDTNELGDATDELRSNLNRVKKLIRDR